VFRTYIHGQDALSRAHRHTHTHGAAMFPVFPRISGEKISACAGVPRRRFPEEISWEVWRAREYRFQSVWDCVGCAFSLPTLRDFSRPPPSLLPPSAAATGETTSMRRDREQGSNVRESRKIEGSGWEWRDEGIDGYTLYYITAVISLSLPQKNIVYEQLVYSYGGNLMNKRKKNIESQRFWFAADQSAITNG